ncbi:MAG TPA: helix-turn-helix transcriptional regulator [Gaiellales bacterium]
MYCPPIPVALERRVLSMVGEVMGLLDLEELCGGLLRALREEIPAEWCALNELPVDLPRTVSLTDPPVPPEIHEAFARYGAQNPLVERYLRTRDGRAVRLSDVVTRRDLHRLDLYREVYRPLGVEYQMAFTLPSSSQRVLGVALSRGARDFSVRERDLLNLARPYLIQAYRNALAHTALAGAQAPTIELPALRALGLSERQSEVLLLVSMGSSNADVAASLGIGLRTAQKHLEACFATLGVRTRSDAARIAWATVAAEPVASD